MPFYLHQWRYKDAQIRSMLLEPEDRAEVIRAATEAFGGTLHHFFYSFGEYDGVAISEYPDNETALASLMSIFAQGRISEVHTTLLFHADEGLRSLQLAREVIGPTDSRARTGRRSASKAKI
ncbi:putative GYD family protein [Paraburkholderia piptadeniae]|uniref:GYD family protein n=1 Tax=Paraburkholderia piptadeniae TaxID=1701573 RepID=A0A1N7RPU1_9BURK|nr:GYD domain-containing protein [Paraburkholderia piptadeniae]SIT37114.1 putative GYD family protein [Paraburkholderia piptadeniae]